MDYGYRHAKPPLLKAERIDARLELMQNWLGVTVILFAAFAAWITRPLGWQDLVVCAIIYGGAWIALEFFRLPRNKLLAVS